MLLLAALAALAAPAASLPPPPGAAPELARMSAQMDAIIAASHARNHFTNDTRRGLPAARHKDSGLRCIFEKAPLGNEIVLIGSIDGGGGVGCLSRPAGFRQSLEAVRLGRDQTLDSVFEGSVRNITWEREARPHDPSSMTVRVEPGIGGKAPPKARTAGYLVRTPQGEVYSRVSVAIIGDWVIRQSFEAPADRSEEAALLADVVMSTTLIDLASRAG